MTITQCVFTYLISWWMVLFMVLPFWVTHSAQREPGHAPSAPERPRLKRKLLITSLLAFIPTLILMSITDAKAGIYHAGSNDCAPSANYQSPADLAATDTNATLDPYPTDSLTQPRIYLNAPVGDYVDTDKYNVDLTQSDLNVGVVDVRKQGTYLNGHPITGGNAYSTKCAQPKD